MEASPRIKPFTEDDISRWLNVPANLSEPFPAHFAKFVAFHLNTYDVKHIHKTMIELYRGKRSTSVFNGRTKRYSYADVVKGFEESREMLSRKDRPLSYEKRKSYFDNIKKGVL